ncbi:MAG TPA: thioesterase family protein [Thermoanaerobaculia bacterium]|nr:thioesterase family protein [Thermoanaerobaculia bacterium]
MSPMSETRNGHVEPIAVRWADMDSMGHVNNAKYFTYCESARMSYFAAIRMYDHREDEKHGPALAAAHLNFRQQVRYPAELDVLTRVFEIGRSSFRMDYEIVYRGTDVLSERVADGHGVIVWVDYGTGRSIPLPESLKQAIREYEGERIERFDRQS